MIETFYKDAIRVRVTNEQDYSFIGPLTREHLREDLGALIYKYGSNPKGEWSMLAEVSRIPLPGDSPQLSLDEAMDAEDTNSVSVMLDQINTAFNGLQEIMGSVSYPDIAVSPVAVYREITPDSGD